MDDDDAIRLMFIAQMVFGGIALAGLALAAAWQGNNSSLGFTLGSCAAVVFCQKFGQSYALTHQTRDRHVAGAAWWASVALGVAAFIALL